MEIQRIDRSQLTKALEVVRGIDLSITAPDMKKAVQEVKEAFQQKMSQYICITCKSAELEDQMLLPAYIHALSGKYLIGVMALLGKNLPVDCLYTFQSIKKQAVSSIFIPSAKLCDAALLYVGLYSERVDKVIGTDALLNAIFRKQ